MDKILDLLDVSPDDSKAIKAKQRTKEYCEKLLTFGSFTEGELSQVAINYYQGCYDTLKDG